jgi:nucleotide-binding universal stress UspA family protein
LVPVDFSSCSRAALSFAANFVRCVHAPLLVLHVVHEAGDEAGFYRSNGATGMLLPLEDVAGKMLKDFVGEVLQADDLESLEKRVSLILVSGVPVSRIREVAERERAALIVMGTHGRVGLARLTRGSVAHDVAHQTRVPVTIVKAPEEYGPDADPVTSTDWWFNAGPVRPEPDTTELRAAT